MITHICLRQEYEITDGEYKILCDVEEDGSLTVTTLQGKAFQFISSKKEVIGAIGNMLCYIAGHF